MSSPAEKLNSYPEIAQCSYRELGIHIRSELVRLYAKAGEPVDTDVLARLSKLEDAALTLSSLLDNYVD